MRGTDSSPQAGSTGGERPRWFALLLFIGALLPRLYVALAWARHPVWDGHFYDYGAQRIALGLGYTDDLVREGVSVVHPWSHYPVGYPALLGGVYRLLGYGPNVAPVLNALLGALLAVVIYRLARYATSEGRARIAGGLVAAHPGLVVYSALVMTELCAALGLAVAAWVASRTRGSWRGMLLAGLVLGLTTLVRPQSILLAPAIALFAPPARSLQTRVRQGLRAATVATAVALAVVGPWTLRNCLVMDGCAFVSTNAGWNLAIGSFPGATGRFATLRARDGCEIITGQVQQDRCWVEKGLSWIRQDPGRWLGLMPRKLALTFDHESYPIGYLAEADPAGWPAAERERARGLLTGVHRLLLWVAALGVLARPSRRSRPVQLVAFGVVLAFGCLAVAAPPGPYWPLAVLICVFAALRLPGAPRNGGAVGYGVWALATVCLTHVVFFGEDRYHMAITPLLCLLAACAWRSPDDPPAAAADAPATTTSPCASA